MPLAKSCIHCAIC